MINIWGQKGLSSPSFAPKGKNRFVFDRRFFAMA